MVDQTRRLFCILLIACLFFASFSKVSAYSATAKRLVDHPFLSSLNNQSIFEYNYNAAYVPLQDGEDALLVRCQSNNDAAGLSPSNLALVKFTDFENLEIQNITEQTVVFKPNNSLETYGTEDPRIVYREKDSTYYLLYSAVAVDPIVSRLSMATSTDPSDPESWVRHGQVFPDCTENCTDNRPQWTKSGALLIRDDYPGPHYLIFGDSTLEPGIQIATSNDLFNWTVQDGIYLEKRSDHFDSGLVESGPAPLLLSDGNYFFLYNSARPNDTTYSGVQYNMGWAILNGTDPTQILQRSEVPMFSPELPWEIGQSPNLGLVPNVVFCEGMKKIDDKDEFIIFYGASDSVLGAAHIVVSLTDE